ncbi:MAG: hypothetical protein H0T75_08810 [Rhizobiales bacterium]|nr:hypothetical protein [Hyphomicrobiales bacterium]
MAQAFGVQPPGMRGVLGRLGAEARRPQIYRALVGLMADGGDGAKFLSHGGALPDNLILTAAALPPPLRSKRVLKEVLFHPGAPERAAAFAWSVKRLEALEGPHTVAAVLKDAKPLRALDRWQKALPFPTPPWPGGKFAPRLHSVRPLRQSGRKTMTRCWRAYDVPNVEDSRSE